MGYGYDLQAHRFQYHPLVLSTVLLTDEGAPIFDLRYSSKFTEPIQGSLPSERPLVPYSFRSGRNTFMATVVTQSHPGTETTRKVFLPCSRSTCPWTTIPSPVFRASSHGIDNPVDNVDLFLQPYLGVQDYVHGTALFRLDS